MPDLCAGAWALTPAQRRALQDAAQWHVQLGDNDSAADRAAWQLWLAVPVNRWAWQRVEQMRQRLLGLSGVGADTLELADGNPRVSRRALLRSVALLAGTSAIGWGTWRYTPAGQMLADQRTVTGEIRSIVLDDGSLLTLNTASAVDVLFDATQRSVTLRQGEILIDAASDARAFVVRTDQGRLLAQHGRFSVRRFDDRIRISVYEQQLEITTRANDTTICKAGQCIEFTRDNIAAPVALKPGEGAWQRGMLVADGWRLDDFLRELARYRSGVLRCDPVIAGYRVSGAFRIDNTDQALAALARLFPVQVKYHTRYWVSVGPLAEETGAA